VPCRDEPWDELPTEGAGGARYEDSHPFLLAFVFIYE
jgi:hypothetical protein